MGGNPTGRRHRVATTRLTGAIAVIALSVATLACSDGDTASPGQVDKSGAYTAIIEWQAGEQEPVVNDDGTVKLPVIYVVAADGATIDVGVQASVAEATVDMADVRFADESSEAFDGGVDGEPVIDHGVMLLVGAIPDPARTIDVDLLRYLAVDTSSPFRLQITADATSIASATVTSATTT